MWPISSVVVFVSAVLMLGALMAPWVYWAVHTAAESWPWLAGMTRQPFHRFVSRSMLGVAILGLWPLTRQLRIRPNELGLRFSPEARTQFRQGLVLGFATLAAVAMLALLFGARSWNADLSWSTLGGKLLAATLTALFVGTIEEILFRGVLFGAFRKEHNWVRALLISSVLYAWFHFFRRPGSPEVVRWYSGFELLGKMLGGLIEFESLVPGFFVLLLAGIILGFAFQKTGALWFSIGTHAGWIFWLKIYGTLTVEIPGANRMLWGSAKLTDGWAAGFVLFLLAALLHRDFSRVAKYNVKPA